MPAHNSSPTQQALGLEYEEGHSEQSVTALVGIPLLVQASRSLGLPSSVQRMYASNSDCEDLTRPPMSESFVTLNAAGGECLDDFTYLRKDAVSELIGHELPSPEATRKF
jgi:hypothetical protein